MYRNNPRWIFDADHGAGGGGGHFNFLFYSIYKKTINFSTRIIETVTGREV